MSDQFPLPKTSKTKNLAGEPSASTASIMTENSTHILSKYFECRPFLVSKAYLFENHPNRKRGQRIRLSVSPACYRIRIMNKYFGKKVTYVSNHQRYNSAIHRAKYIQSAKFSQVWRQGLMKAADCITFRALGDMVVLDPDIHIRTVFLFRILLSCNKNIQVEVKKLAAPCTWDLASRETKSLVSDLNLLTPEVADHVDKNSFEDFSYLTSFRLNHEASYRRNDCLAFDASLNTNYLSKQIPTPFNFGFLQSLIPMHTLQIIDMDLSNIRISESSMTSLFNLVEKHDKPRWYIRTLIKLKYIIDHPHPAFQKIDCLGFIQRTQYSADQGIVCSSNGYSDYRVTILNNRKDLTRGRQRVLDLIITLDDAENLLPALDCFTALEVLYMYFHYHSSNPDDDYEEGDDGEEGGEGDDDYDDESDNDDENEDDSGELCLSNKPEPSQSEQMFGLEQPKRWASSLKTAVLNFNTTTNSHSFRTRLHPIINSIISTIKTQSLNLQTLELLFCNSNLTPLRSFRKANYQFESKTEGLEKLSLLESLKIPSHGQGLQQLGNTISQLPNLKKLHVMLGELKPTLHWDAQFPFGCIDHLKELKIEVLHDMKKGWGKDLLKNLHNLQHLNVLEITGRSEITEKMADKLAKSLACLKSLRRLTFKVSIKDANKKVANPGFDSSLAAREARKYVQGLFTANSHLEEINVDCFIVSQKIKLQRSPLRNN